MGGWWSLGSHGHLSEFAATERATRRMAATSAPARGNVPQEEEAQEEASRHALMMSCQQSLKLF